MGDRKGYTCVSSLMTPQEAFLASLGCNWPLKWLILISFQLKGRRMMEGGNEKGSIGAAL